MLALLLVAGIVLGQTDCITAPGVACETVQTVDRQVLLGDGDAQQFSVCGYWYKLPDGSYTCSPSLAKGLPSSPYLSLVPHEDQRDIGPTIRDARTCKDALWLVVRDAIDVLSGRDLRIKATLQRAAEACE